MARGCPQLVGESCQRPSNPSHRTQPGRRATAPQFGRSGGGGGRAGKQSRGRVAAQSSGTRDPASAPAAAGECVPSSAETTSRRPPISLPVAPRPRFRSYSWHSLRDFAACIPPAPPPRTPATQRGLVPDTPHHAHNTHSSERREMQTCCRAQGSDEERSEPRSTLGMQPPPSEPCRCWSAAPRAGLAEPALTWNPRLPLRVSTARSPGSRPRPLSLFTLLGERSEPAPASASPRRAPS